MRDYAKVAPTFWTGETGKKIRFLGRDAQVVALYLITCPNSNWLGLYYLPLPVLCHEVGISSETAAGVLKELSGIDFAYYDLMREQVWVPCMAKYQIAERLKKEDKRIIGIVKDLRPYFATLFGQDFYRRYREPFSLPDIPVESNAPGCPLEGPPMPGTETEAGTRTETRTEIEEIGALRPLPFEVESEGSKAEKATVEVPNAKAKPGPEILFEIFDQENKQLPQVKVRSRERMAKCRSRINQAVSSGCLEQYLTDFRAAVSKGQSTPFLCGDNQRGWRADFDWFVANHTNPYRVLEGKYDGKGGNSNGASEGSARPAERNPFSSGPRYERTRLHPEIA